MSELKRLELPESALRALPLGLRTIYCKEVPGDGREAGVHRLEPYGAEVVPSWPWGKPLSRIGSDFDD